MEIPSSNYTEIIRGGNTYKVPPLLIGLNGFKGVGKDTVGKILIDEYGFRRMAFADKLKEAAAALLGLHAPVFDSWKNDPEVKIVVIRETGNHIFPRVITHMTFRDFLKRFGTEMGRMVFGADFWIDLVLPYKEPSTAMADRWYRGNTVVTDARFENEMFRIRQLGGYNIRIERPGYEGDNHLSEQKPPQWLIDYTIHNDGTKDTLLSKVASAIRYINNLEVVSDA